MPVRLRSGKIVDGTLIGADSKTVRCCWPTARVQNSRSAMWKDRVDGPGGSPSAAAQPGRQARADENSIGTVLNVRLTQGIDVDSSQAGHEIQGVVDDPVMLNGKVVIPRGAGAMLQAVQVQQSGTMKGSDKITLKMNTLYDWRPRL